MVIFKCDVFKKKLVFKIFLTYKYIDFSEIFVVLIHRAPIRLIISFSEQITIPTSSRKSDTGYRIETMEEWYLRRDGSKSSSTFVER